MKLPAVDDGTGDFILCLLWALHSCEIEKETPVVCQKHQLRNSKKKKMLEVKEEDDTHNACDAIIIITMKRHLFWTTFFILIEFSSPRLAFL